MKNNFVIICFVFFMSGCIFSGTDIEETKVVEPYYITYSGLNHQLIIKEKGASTNKVVITSNVDSIGHYDKFIFGKTGAEYFIINKETQNFEGRYNEYSSFMEAKRRLDLPTEMESTN
jgi:hypothetical protein